MASNICLKLFREDEAPRTRIVDVLNDDFGVTYRVNDIADIIKSKSSTSKGLKLLGTRRTHEAFEWLFRLDTISDNIVGKAIPCLLEVDGIDVLRGGGVLTVSKIETDLHDTHTVYQCQVTAGRFRWASLMRDLKACDLPNLGTHTYDENTVLASLDRKGFYGTVYDETFIGCTYFPVFYGSWKRQAFRINFYDLRPHVYVAWLLAKAFEHLGYTLTGDYVESDDFRELVILFGRGIFTAQADEINSAKCEVYHGTTRCYEAFSLTTGEGLFLDLATNDCNNWNGFVWTQPGTIGVEMEFTFRIEPGVTTTGIAFEIIKNFGLAGQTSITQVDYDSLNGNIETFRICMNPGDTMRVFWRWESITNPSTCPACFPAGSGCGGFGSNPRIELFPLDARLTATPVSVIDGYEPGSPLVERCLGTTVNLCETIDPTLTMKEVVDGLTHARGLLWLTNETNKTVTPIPASDFLIGTDTVDYTGNLDKKQKITRSLSTNANNCPNFVFGYKEANDEWYGGELWDNRKFDGTGLYSVTQIEDVFNPCLKQNRNPTFDTIYVTELERDYQNEEQSTIPPFRALYLSLVKKVIEIPSGFDPDNKLSYDFAPRLAKYEGLVEDSEIGWTQSTGNLWQYETEGGVAFDYPVFPYAYVVDYYQLTRRSLSYADITRPTVSPTGAGGPETTSEGIVNAEYDILYRILKQGIRYELWFYFTPAEIVQLDFSKFIKLNLPEVGQGVFYLSQVKDWRPSDGLCKCEIFHLPDGYPTV